MRRSKRHCNTNNKLTYETLETRCVLATLTVNSDLDAALVAGAGNDDGTLTLREALAVVNGTYLLVPGDPNGDQKQIDNISTLGTNDRIIFNLPGGVNVIELEHGPLSIRRSVVIDGADGADVYAAITIDASMSANPNSVFKIIPQTTAQNANVDVTVNGLLFTGRNDSVGEQSGGYPTVRPGLAAQVG